MHNDGILMDTGFMETRGPRPDAAAMMTLCKPQQKVYHYETLNSFLAKIALYF